MPVDLRLRPMRGEDEAVALAAHDALAADSFDFLLGYNPGEPWEHHLAAMELERRGVGLPAGRVPHTFLLATGHKQVVGRASIRHQLNDHLARWGGHIGYAVLPQHRRRGWATEILRQSLIVARSVGVDRVLLTCDDDNVASIAVIERCGGVLEDVIPGESPGPAKRRYWID